MKAPKIPAPEPVPPPVSQRAGQIENAEDEEIRRLREQNAFNNTILRPPGGASGNPTLGY